MTAPPSVTDRPPTAPDRIERAVRRASAYNHRRFEIRRRFVRWFVGSIAIPAFLRIEQPEGLENIPAAGPAILMFNHIAFVDPLAIIAVLPRNVVPLAKAEVLASPFLALVPWVYGAITIRRGEVDRQALVKAIQVLRAGELVLLAPEGTRSPALLPAKEGVAYLASKADVPVIPIAVEGTEGFPSLRRGLRNQGPASKLRFGRAFRFRTGQRRPDRAALEKMTREAMYVLAGMLPAERRGAYADLSKASHDTLELV